MFELIKYLTFEKKSWQSLTDSQRKEFNKFRANQILSQIPEYIEIVNQVNHTHFTDEETYNYYLLKLPVKRMYINYVKKSETKYSKELVKIIYLRFKESKKNIEFYLSLFTREDIETYLIQCGLDDKEIKKLLVNVK